MKAIGLDKSVEEIMKEYSVMGMPELNKQERKELNRKTMYYLCKQNESLASQQMEEVIYTCYLTDNLNNYEAYGFKSKLNYNPKQWYAILLNEYFHLTKEQLRDVITELF